MITLKELIDVQKITDDSDIKIIKDFFIQNDLEEDAIKMMAELSEAKINKLNNHINIFKTWAHILPSEYLYKNYDLDTATRLHDMELNYLAYDGELSHSMLKWAKENVPSIKRPEVYFNPLVEWLERQNIKFSDR